MALKETLPALILHCHGISAKTRTFADLSSLQRMEWPHFLPPCAEQQGVNLAPMCTMGLSLFCLWAWNVNSEAIEKGALGRRQWVTSCLQGSPHQASACLLLKMTPIQMAEAKPRRKSWHHQQRTSARPGCHCVLEKQSLVCVGNGTGSADDSQHLAPPALTFVAGGRPGQRLPWPVQSGFIPYGNANKPWLLRSHSLQCALVGYTAWHCWQDLTH